MKKASVTLCNCMRYPVCVTIFVPIHQSMQFITMHLHLYLHVHVHKIHSIYSISAHFMELTNKQVGILLIQVDEFSRGGSSPNFTWSAKNDMALLPHNLSEPFFKTSFSYSMGRIISLFFIIILLVGGLNPSEKY